MIDGVKKIKFTGRCMSGKARIVLVCPQGRLDEKIPSQIEVTTH